MEEYLASIYFDPEHPASFSGPDKLYKTVKEEGRFDVSHQQISQWLQAQEAYTLHHEVRTDFPRNRVVVGEIDQQWDLDTANMVSFSKKNKGFNYILVAIDIFSRYLWTRPLKTKLGKEMVEALKSIFEEGRRPLKIRSDKGGEFVNRQGSAFLKREKIHHFVTQNEVKCSHAARMIKTLKNKISHYFTHKQTHEWVDVLQDFTKSYNHTFHRSIGISPAQVTKEKEPELWLHQYLPPPKVKKERKKPLRPKIRYKFKVGDTVRISHLRSVFQREYDQRWTTEIFKVRSRDHRGGLPIYHIEDWDGEEVIGSFYEPELKKVKVDETTEYKVEKVLQRRKRKGQVEVKVKWMNWPAKFNSWIPEKQLKNLV